MVKPRLVLVLGDQLTTEIAALRAADKARDVVVMAEVMDEARYVPHHPKKIALVLAAMRKFAAALEADGWQVAYARLDDSDNAGSIPGELLRRADTLGIDRQRVVLMGHSAGAHLVALVGTDPQYLAGAGLTFSDVAGIIPLDGAGYDVPSQMGENQALLGDTYEQAFGTDPARQLALSPTSHAAAPNAPAFLILHVERADAKRQSEGLATALRSAGTPVELREVAGRGLRGHMEINRELGKPDYAATPIVDAWLKARFGS